MAHDKKLFLFLAIILSSSYALHKDQNPQDDAQVSDGEVSNRTRSSGCIERLCAGGEGQKSSPYVTINDISRRAGSFPIFEFRIPQPLTVEDQRLGLTYMLQRTIETERNGDEPAMQVLQVEERVHEVYGPGVFSRKRFNIDRRLPGWIRAMVPKRIVLEEEAWDLFPLMISSMRLPVLSGFSLRIQSTYLNGTGHVNAHNMDGIALKRRLVRDIDIANTGDVPKSLYHSAEDPTVVGLGNGKGLLKPGWVDRWDGPISTCYKVLIVELPWTIPFQSRVQKWIGNFEYDIFKRAARQTYTWAHEWGASVLHEAAGKETMVNSSCGGRTGTEEASPSASSIGVESCPGMLTASNSIA